MAWIRLGALDGMPTSRGVRVVVAARPLALFRRPEGVFCIDDGCTHAEASLADGWVEDTRVTCPWHAAEFCLKTGQALSPPASDPVGTYPVRIVDGRVEVDLPDPPAAPSVG
jgi:nitrite reductase/ring-hydroxylating ferredoxin subunit